MKFILLVSALFSLMAAGASAEDVRLTGGESVLIGSTRVSCDGTTKLYCQCKQNDFGLYAVMQMDRSGHESQIGNGHFNLEECVADMKSVPTCMP